MKGIRRFIQAAVMIAGLTFLLTGCSKSVDFLQYADVTFDGLNGQAVADVAVDYNKFGTDVLGKGKSQTDMDEARTEAAMLGEVVYTVTPSENLSNGDTATLSVEVSDYFQKENKVTAKGASKTITVSGLKEPEMVDPFDDSVFTTVINGNADDGKVSVRITGTLPDLTFNVTNSASPDDPRSMLEYYKENPTDFRQYSSDDTITIKVNVKSDSDFDQQYALTRDSIEVPLKDVPKHISSPDEVTTEILDAVKPIAAARLEDTLSYNVDRMSVFDANHEEVAYAVTNIGAPRWANVGYLITLQDGVASYSKEYNDLFIPYEVDYETENPDETGTAVLGFWIKNVIINADGTADLGDKYSLTMTAYNSMEAFKANEIDIYSSEYDISEFDVNW